MSAKYGDGFIKKSRFPLFLYPCGQKIALSCLYKVAGFAQPRQYSVIKQLNYAKKRLDHQPGSDDNRCVVLRASNEKNNENATEVFADRFGLFC